jgi:hypothetical protein
MSTLTAIMPETNSEKPFAPEKDTTYVTGDLAVADAKRGYLIPDVNKPVGRWANYGNSSRDSMDGDERSDVYLTSAY